MIKDKFYKYQLQIEPKAAILSQVEENMKSLSESEDLADLKMMVNLKKSLTSEEGSIEVIYIEICVYACTYIHTYIPTCDKCISKTVHLGFMSC